MRMEMLSIKTEICCIFHKFHNTGSYFNLMDPKRLILILCLCFAELLLKGQDYRWWNELHNWDGISSWKEYITYSSAYMGPNAIPVPEINSADFTDLTLVEMGLQQHLSEGDRTINFISDVFIPVVPQRTGIRIHYIPCEFYETDTYTRDLRAARDYDPTGSSFGDFYVSTYIQVIKDHRKMPDLLLTINLKTASGTNLGNARHTDAPGYYFDASFGRTFQTGKAIITSWRPFFMGGFYSYQTNRRDYLQNDALLFGMGVIVSTPVLQIENRLGGYMGFFGNGDQPVVYRMKFLSRRESIVNYKLEFQSGLHDFPYSSIAISFIMRFEKLKFFWGRQGSGNGNDLKE